MKVGKVRETLGKKKCNCLVSEEKRLEYVGIRSGLAFRLMIDTINKDERGSGG